MQENQTCIKITEFQKKLIGTDAEPIIKPILENAPEFIRIDWLLNEAIKTSAYFQVKSIITTIIHDNKG